MEQGRFWLTPLGLPDQPITQIDAAKIGIIFETTKCFGKFF